MVKEHTLATRYSAGGMIKGLKPQAQVGRDQDIGEATIRRWQTCDDREKTLENRTGRGSVMPTGQDHRGEVGLQKAPLHENTG